MNLEERKKIRKILLIKNDHIGDIVLSSGVFRELKKAFPWAKITLIASPINKELVEKNKNIDKIMVLKFSPRTLKDFISYFKMSMLLRKEKFDLGIDLRGGFFNIFFLIFLSGVKYRVGFYHQWLGKFFLHYGKKKTPKEKTKTHCTLARLDLINQSLGLNAKNSWPEVATDKEDEKKVISLIKKEKLKRFICIVPDARADKQFPLEKMDILIKSLNKKYPSKKIVLLGIDKNQINWLKERNPASVSILNLNLRLVYLLFQKSDLVIAHDGGPVHLAWVGHSRTLDLIEKHLPLRWIHPLGKNTGYICAELKKLSVKEVLDLADKLIRH